MKRIDKPSIKFQKMITIKFYAQIKFDPIVTKIY